ncbi:M64 family metallopeptidase [Kribbella sp. CA-293567]|uniref:M64 family metallopeptidase n=1 Tax=Kribbella sp. CA-293567 TaxID=3002436 RepID=UPI0022DE5DA0|nr:M64 family metallopeptidase [Kribbella sp. CA-293567]WBQ03250.1 M64 family metallo-endopeptidase [Kribbella sp. CA-293567]
MRTTSEPGRLAALAGLTAAVLTASATITASATVPATAVGPAAIAAAPATVVPLQVTGPASSRFNLVVMGDGYTSAELPKFREQLDKHLNVLWSIEPFKSYRNYINVYAVEIPSPESGVDCDPGLTSPKVDTPLQMGFWGGCNPGSVQRLLTVSATAAAEYAALVPGTTPANRQILAIGNSDTYGGAGGSYATASGGNALSALITPHELGHSLGGLQDEYDYYARGDRGAPYDGPEPGSIHHTLLTEQQMLAEQKKWFRWLGEPSDSGGPIARYEAGMYAGSGVWRPSRHSMMKVLGYYFDQVSRERMTQRISARTTLFQASTPPGPVAPTQVVWLQTLHPASHELDVTWTLDGTALSTNNQRHVDLAALDLTGTHTLTAKVVDPTPFVRDPAIRASSALTATRTWTITPTAVPQPATSAYTFTTSTPTDHPVNATEVVYVETTQSDTEQPPVSWQLDGRPIANPGNDRDLALAPLALTGTHTLTARVGADQLSWQVDATGPTVGATLSKPLLKITKPTGPEYIFNDAFTMALKATDDSPGYVVPEFRVNGDGWYNYYGWPTDATAPFKFTAEGTEIDQLVYGKLGVPRVVPWDDVPSGYGRHQVEYRAIDAPGNIATPDRFAVTLLRPPPTCTTTVTGQRNGPLTVTTGVTCLTNATVNGPVTVRDGASLVATDSKISGPVTATKAADLHLLRTTVNGPVTLTATSRSAVLVGTTVSGPVTVRAAATAEPVVLAGNTVNGPLTCSANSATPTNLQAPNQVTGPRAGQCANL